jgi:hypothetical protein
MKSTLLLLSAAVILSGCNMVPMASQLGRKLSVPAVASKPLPPNYHAHQIGEAHEKVCIADLGITERAGLADRVTSQALAKGGDFVGDANFELGDDLCMVLNGKLMALDNGSVAEDETMGGRDPAAVGRVFEVVGIAGGNVEIMQHSPDQALQAQREYPVYDAAGEKRGTVHVDKVDGQTAWGTLKDGKAFWGWSLKEQ